MAGEDLQPGEVAVVDRSGKAFAVPESQVKEAQRQGAHVAGHEELAQVLHGSPVDQTKTALLGAANTVTMGGATAALSEAGVLSGGQEGRGHVENELRGLNEANPISRMVGETAPLLLAPEAGGEELMSQLGVRGQGIASSALRFALPQFARGVAETGYLQGTAGISDDLLDHDMSAQSFYMHAATPETVFGGLLNVGVATGFAGLGKLTSKLGSKWGGALGEAAADDVGAYEGVVKSVQGAGRSSDEAQSIVKELSAVSEGRSVASTPEQKAISDRAADAVISRFAKGDPDIERQLRMMYSEGRRVSESLDVKMDGHAKEIEGHAVDLVNKLEAGERYRSGLRQSEIQKYADPTKVTAAADAANSINDLLDALTRSPIEPPHVEGQEYFEKEIAKEWRKQGTKPPKDEMQLASYNERKTAFAEAARESALAEREAEVVKLHEEHRARIPQDIAELHGYDPATRLGMDPGQMGALQSQVSRARNEIKAALASSSPMEAHARLVTVIDDQRKLIGQMGGFGKPGAYSGSAAKRLEQHIYETRIRPVLEDSNIVGDNLSDMFAQTNKAVSETIKAPQAFREAFMSSVESGEHGQPIYRGKGGLGGASPFRTFVEGLERAPGSSYAEDIVQRTADAARARGNAMLKTMDLSASQKADIVGAIRSADAMEAAISKARETASDARDIRLMKQRETAAGTGGVIGKMLSAATSPARTMETLANLRQIEVKARNELAEQSQKFFQGNREPSVKLSLGEVERKAANESIQKVKQYASDPRSLALSIKPILGDMPETAPNVASAIAVTFARGAMALSKRAPSPMPRRFSDKDGDPPRYANGELEKYWRNKTIVENPKILMTMFRSGQISQDDAELFQEVLPRVYAQMQMQLEKDIVTARDKGGLQKMSYQEQLALSWMVGHPLDATQDPSFIMAMQQSAASDPVNQGAIGAGAAGGGRPSALANINLERYETLQERMEK